MTLLAPGAMALAAALTIPPLVVFYLLKLRRRPLRVTSTMFWEQAAHDLQVNVPLRWIRPSWLLLLHAAILALLLVAVGRPAIETGGTDAGRVFVLIDRSASMSARDMPGGRTRLEAAKRLALDEIEDLSGGLEPPEMTVIAFAAEPVVMGPASSSRGTVSALVESISPTDQPGDAEAALALVRSLTAGRPEDDEGSSGVLIVLVSDGGGLDRVPASADPLRFVAVEPERGRSLNAGIVAFSAERDVERPESLRVFVRLLNTGPAEVAAPLVVTVDGEVVWREAVRVPPAGAMPGERVATVDLERETGGVLGVSLEHEDVLASDNSVMAVAPPVDRPAVLLVAPPARGPDDPADTRARADPFLVDVLEAIGPAGLRVIDLDRYERTGAGSEAGFGLIVFDRVAPSSPPPRPTISFGAPWPGLGDSAFVAAEVSGRTPIVSWDRDHPVMRDAVLDTIVVADRLVLAEEDASAPGVDGEERRARRTLARGQDGPLIAEIDDRGTPRIVVGFSLDQSNWPVHFSFAIFMLSAFDHLTPGSATGLWHGTGEATTVRLDRPLSTLSLTGPVSREVRVPGDAPGTAVPMGRLERAGLYRLEGAGGAVSVPIAVNVVDPVESSLGVLDVEELPAAGGPGASEGTGSREVWRLFVLAAGALLVIEWVVYALRARA